MAKTKPLKKDRDAADDSGDTGGTPQSGLFSGGGGATLDLLRPLIDQLVKGGLDALVGWLKKNSAAVQHLPNRDTDPPCDCLVPACPDAVGKYMLVCDNGTMSWQLVGATHGQKVSPGGGGGPDE